MVVDYQRPSNLQEVVNQYTQVCAETAGTGDQTVCLTADDVYTTFGWNKTEGISNKDENGSAGRSLPDCGEYHKIEVGRSC